MHAMFARQVLSGVDISKDMATHSNEKIESSNTKNNAGVKDSTNMEYFKTNRGQRSLNTPLTLIKKLSRFVDLAVDFVVDLIIDLIFNLDR